MRSAPSPRLRGEVKSLNRPAPDALIGEAERFHLVGGGRTFPTRVQADAWVAAVLIGFGGGKCGREVYAGLSERGKIPAGVGRAEFAELLLWLVERDILRMEGAE